MRQRAAAFIGLLVVLSAAVIYYVVGGTQTAVATCDTGSMAYFAAGAEKQGDIVKARYLREEIEACEAGYKESETPASSAPETTTPPSSEAPATSPAVDSSTAGTIAPSTIAVVAPAPAPVGCTVEYLANRPADQKVSVNSYGPQTAQSPALGGKAMDSLTTEEALAEGQYRRSIDPMLSVEDAISFGVLPSDIDQVAKTQELASNCQAWSDLNAAIDAEMANYDHSVQALAPGKWASTYALAGEIPAVAMDSDVDRDEPFPALVSVRRSDGHVVNRRLACGFQLYQQVATEAPAVVQAAPELPAPSPGMSRTPEGTPVVTPPGSTPSSPPVVSTTVPSTTVLTTTQGSTPSESTTPGSTTPVTSTTQTTTTSVEKCLPPTPYGTPETGCKDTPGDRPTDIPDQQQPNPLPAASSDFQTAAATPPATYAAPASPDPVPGGGGEPAPNTNESSFEPAPTNTGVNPTDGSGNSGVVPTPN